MFVTAVCVISYNVFIFVNFARKDFGGALSTGWIDNNVVYAQKCTVSSERANDLQEHCGRGFHLHGTCNKRKVLRLFVMYVTIIYPELRVSEFANEFRRLLNMVAE